MQPNILIDELPPQLPKRSKVAIDVEIFGMDMDRAHRPDNGTFACVQICSDEQDVYVITREDMVAPAMDRVRDSYLIFHNAQFDLRHLRRWSDTIEPTIRLHDTMLAEQGMYKSYYEAGLNHLARRYLHFHMEKETRNEFATATELDESKIYYAALDALVTRKVAQAQRPTMSKDALTVYRMADLPTMWAVLDFKGWLLDQEEWRRLAEKREARADEILEELGFNPRSPQQTRDALAEVGHKIQSTNAKILEQIDHPIAQETIKYRRNMKLASTYGLNWFEKYLEEDGRIYSDYLIVGAVTGRMASLNPNGQNIPVRRDPEYRGAFIAPPGYVIFRADFSSQEMRIMAQLSQDERLLEILHQGDDPYIKDAEDIFGVSGLTKQSPEREDIKTLTLGTQYGLSAYGYARRTGKTKDDAKAIVGQFFHLHPGIKRYMQEQRRCGDYVTTLLGRRCWINRYDSAWERHAYNYPIQGSAADQEKVAIGMFHRAWQPEWGPFGAITVVHDEIVGEAPEEYAEEIGQALQDCMVRSGKLIHPDVPAVAEVKFGRSWKETK